MARRLALHHNRLWAVLRAEPGRWLGRARCVCACVCVCVCVCVRLLSLVLMCYLALHNQGKGYVHVAPRGQALSREPASAKYVTVLCMHTLSREDKMSILRVMMQGEADQALHAFLQDRLGHDQCDLDGLCKLLQEAD